MPHRRASSPNFVTRPFSTIKLPPSHKAKGEPFFLNLMPSQGGELYTLD